MPVYRVSELLLRLLPRGRAVRGGRRLSLAIVAWLALSMLGAQLAGFGHRIAHPHGLAGGVAQAAQSHGVHDDGGHHHPHAHDALVGGDIDGAHDCAAYDAATLGDGPPQLPTVTAAAQQPSAGPGPLGLTQPGSAPQLGFQSRAPPRA